MNRTVTGFDRVLAGLLGLALLAAGAWLVAWVLDRLPGGWPAPDRLTLGLDASVTDATWWTWLLLAGGLLLVGLGGAWLVAHLRSSAVERLSMPGDADGGRILLDGRALARGAADGLVAQSPEITDASGRLLDERGRVVLAITATVRDDVDLEEVTRACEAVAERAVATTGRRDLAVRVRLRANARDRRVRVH